MALFGLRSIVVAPKAVAAKKTAAKKVRPAKKACASKPLPQKQELIQQKQKECLKSLQQVLEKLKKDNGIKIFADEQSFYEACAPLEDEAYSVGRDLLLTLFMKKFPQSYVIAKRNDSEFQKLKATYSARLQEELGMRPDFIQRVFKVFSNIFLK